MERSGIYSIITLIEVCRGHGVKDDAECSRRAMIKQNIETNCCRHPQTSNNTPCPLFGLGTPLKGRVAPVARHPKIGSSPRRSDLSISARCFQGCGSESGIRTHSGRKASWRRVIHAALHSSILEHESWLGSSDSLAEEKQIGFRRKEPGSTIGQTWFSPYTPHVPL